MSKDLSRKFFEYARNNGALAFAHYAAAASNNLGDRKKRFLEALEEARVQLRGLEREAQLVADGRVLISRTKTFHYSTLDLIQRLAILSESFFSCLRAVKKNFKRLPFEVLKRDSVWPEVDWAKRVGRKELKTLLMFPRPSSVFRSKQHRATLVRASRLALARIQRSVRGVATFYGRLTRIHNRYKHCVSENTGYTEFLKLDSGNQVKTAIFLEDYVLPSRRSGKRRTRPRPVTWGIFTDAQFLDYIETLVSDAIALHKLLLVTRLDYLHNQGGPFIPAIGDFLTDPELNELSAAVDSERNYRSIGQIGIQLNLHWGPAVRTGVGRQANKYHGVFRLRGHLFHGRKALSTANLQTG